MKRILLFAAAVLILLSFVMSGCGASGAPDGTDSGGVQPGDEIGAASAGNAQSSAGDDLDAIEVDYSDKDKNADYDENGAIKITLSDGGIQIDGNGASANGSVVTISAAATYLVSGTLSNGQLVVDTTKVDTVRIVLDGVSITNESGSAIYVAQAEKAIITLADGSENYVSDSAEYALTGEEDPDAAIYACDDLSINGSGSLTVTGRYKHAIKTVDDLVVTGGTLNLTAVEEGLRGKDSVSILNGDITIDAGGEAIKSDNAEDEGSGWVSIDGGVFDLVAGNNGIEAHTGLMINAGTMNIDAVQDTIHCNGSIRITDGEMTLAAGDDGAHADNALDITGGTIVVSKSYEGLEGAEVTISNGAITVYADDDGLNAAGGSDGDMRPGDQFRDSDNNSSYLIAISGGYTYINSDGDGVDSNGDIEISGGVVVVDGPEMNNNAAIDMEQSSFTVTGGTLIAAGSSGMLVSPTEANQTVMTILFDQTTSGSVAVTDASGNVLFAVDPAKMYQSLMISSSELTAGETYTVLYSGTLSGESADGTYYADAAVSDEVSSADVTIGDMISFVDQDGTATTYSGGMGSPGGMGGPGDGMGGPPGGKGGPGENMGVPPDGTEGPGVKSDK